MNQQRSPFMRVVDKCRFMLPDGEHACSTPMISAVQLKNCEFPGIGVDAFQANKLKNNDDYKILGLTYGLYTGEWVTLQSKLLPENISPFTNEEKMLLHINQTKGVHVVENNEKILIMGTMKGILNSLIPAIYNGYDVTAIYFVNIIQTVDLPNSCVSYLIPKFKK
jgi:hypothetical protein